MRRLLPLSALALAACATTPQPAPPPAPVPQAPAPARQTGSLLGLGQDALVERFGTPSFQVREGVGLKLQWQNGACVLDAYLYPPASGAGAATVTHVDARRPGSGDPVAPGACIASLDRRP